MQYPPNPTPFPMDHETTNLLTQHLHRTGAVIRVKMPNPKSSESYRMSITISPSKTRRVLTRGLNVDQNVLTRYLVRKYPRSKTMDAYLYRSKESPLFLVQTPLVFSLLPATKRRRRWEGGRGKGWRERDLPKRRGGRSLGEVERGNRWVSLVVLLWDFDRVARQPTTGNYFLSILFGTKPPSYIHPISTLHALSSPNVFDLGFFVK